MKHIEKLTTVVGCESMRYFTDDSRPLFFDIETTGFSPDRSHAYLVGCCYPTEEMKDGETLWEFHQWFAENAPEERAMLSAFGDFIRDFDLLVSFNGDTFDIPYLTKRAKKLEIELELEQRTSLDMFKKLRHSKRLLNTPDLKLKTVEAFLGIFREDEYNGGQLIEVYKQNARTPDPETERLLLLHNEEDILHMPALVPILKYPAFLEGNYRVEQVLNAELSKDSIFTVDLKLDLSVPQSVFLKEGCWTGILRGDLLHLSCPLLFDEMKAFFPDYRNYFYLPEEGMAIHKSVAEYVEKDHRMKATKETAFVRKEGAFLPIPGEWCNCGQVFRKEYREEPYLDMETVTIPDCEFWTEYARQFSKRIK